MLLIPTFPAALSFIERFSVGDDKMRLATEHATWVGILSEHSPLQNFIDALPTIQYRIGRIFLSHCSPKSRPDLQSTYKRASHSQHLPSRSCLELLLFRGALSSREQLSFPLSTPNPKVSANSLLAKKIAWPARRSCGCKSRQEKVAPCKCVRLLLLHCLLVAFLEGWKMREIRVMLRFNQVGRDLNSTSTLVGSLANVTRWHDLRYAESSHYVIASVVWRPTREVETSMWLRMIEQ